MVLEIKKTLENSYSESDFDNSSEFDISCHVSKLMKEEDFQSERAF